MNAKKLPTLPNGASTSGKACVDSANRNSRAKTVSQQNQSWSGGRKPSQSMPTHRAVAWKVAIEWRRKGFKLHA